MSTVSGIILSIMLTYCFVDAFGIDNVYQTGVISAISIMLSITYTSTFTK